MRHNYRLLLSRLPGLHGLDVELLIRETVAAARMHRATSWQEAWNLATGAQPRRPGLFRLWTNITCPTCHGRCIDLRRGRVCTECMGRGRVKVHISQPALHIEAPQDQPPVDAQVDRAPHTFSA